MDLKNIKDTELSITDSKFRRSVLASGIVKASAELKNTSAKTPAQRAGLYAEEQVANLLQKHNWELIFHRLKTPIAEIDLVFEKDDKIILVEVKTLNTSWRSFQRIAPLQKNRLSLNLVLFSNFFKEKKVEAYVAWVEKNNAIS